MLKNKLSLYVKDKTNLLSYNLWSGGDYNNTIPSSEYTRGTPTVSVSDECSTLGNHSIKLTYVSSSASWVRFIISNLPDTLNGKTITIGGKMFNSNNAVYSKIMLRAGTSPVSEQGLSVTANTDFNTFEISTSINDETVDGIQLSFSIGADVYLDELYAKLS